MSAPIRIRTYRSSDGPGLARLFYETVHSVCLRDYTQEQVDAWAPGTVDLAAWDRSFAQHFTVVAEREGVPVGFGDMARDGYLDRLYVHRDVQRQGVASALCTALEAYVAAPVFTTHASLTARPFFLARGYQVVREQQVERRGVLLTNFVMEKRVREAR